MRDRSRTVDAAVLGAGPAAVATACALRRMGHSVMLFGSSRQRSLEGLSRRALKLLEQHGLTHAAACAGQPAERGGRWGGSAVSAGHEFIIDRSVFDAGLREDAVSHRVALEEECALAIEPDAGGHRVYTRSGNHRAGALIDARGRRTGSTRARGPSLIALSQRVTGVPAAPPRTLIAPMDDGWCWLACDGGGGAVLQLVTASRGLARRSAPAQRLRECLVALVASDGALASAHVKGEPQARAASARLSASVAPAPGYLHAGDAALSMDPLSGHGIYEALGWADAASAAAHTHLEGKSWAPVECFLTERSVERWGVGIAAAAGFYQQQSASTPTRFWRGCADAYAQLAAAAALAEPAHASWQLRPVLNGSVIEMRRVVVTPERPRGVWQVDRIELARLGDILLSEPALDVAQVARHLDSPPQAVVNAMGWLRANGVLTSTGRARQERAMSQ